jgi:uncharacterized protein (DUF1684 family)
MKKIISLALFLFLSFVGFAQEDGYTKSINDWHQARAEYLKKPKGWLNLEGLFWLHKGVNTFGKSRTADCFYDNAAFPAILGSFIYEGDSVSWKNEKGQSIKIDNNPYTIERPVTVFKTNGISAEMDWSNFSWVVIKREDKIGIRFRNYKAKTLTDFHGLSYFPVNIQWKVKAKLVQPTQDFLMISNIIGQTTAQKNAGKLVFSVDGNTYSLDAIDEGDKTLFVAFADKTTGNTTYGAGRFIDVEKPDAEGNTFIDFNKAYNPPCAFTPFATCPLPPSQNRLQLNIEAGEKNYGHH